MSQLKAHLLRAARDWALDNGLTPHIVVDAAATGVAVPARYVENGRIVLNIHPRSIQHFDLDDAGLRFSARFGGREFLIAAPLNAVLAVYARENGQGITFPPEAATPPAEGTNAPPPEEPPSPGRPPREGPQLKVVK